MLYILNVILPTKKNFKNSITTLYGIGRVRAIKLASLLGLHPSARIEQVDQRKLNRLGILIERAFLIDFELKRKISLNIRSLIKLKTVRGFCHSHGLPTRGQRTHTNASTANKLLRKRSSLLESQNSRNSSSRFSTSSNRNSNKHKSMKNKKKSR